MFWPWWKCSISTHLFQSRCLTVIFMTVVLYVCVMSSKPDLNNQELLASKLMSVSTTEMNSVTSNGVPESIWRQSKPERRMLAALTSVTLFSSLYFLRSFPCAVSWTRNVNTTRVSRQPARLTPGDGFLRTCWERRLLWLPLHTWIIKHKHMEYLSGAFRFCPPTSPQEISTWWTC